MTRIRYKGVRCIDGYFYRSDADQLVYFHSNDPEETGKPDELITTDTEYDSLKWRPFEDIELETRDTNYWVQPYHLEELRRDIREAIKTARIERFFYPHGVKVGTQGHVRWRATLYAYYVAVDEIWLQYSKTKVIDRDWLTVLGFAAYAKETSPEFRLLLLPGQGGTLMRQIHEAKSDEDFARILGIIGPYTAPVEARPPTYEEQQRMRIQRQIAANW